MSLSLNLDMFDQLGITIGDFVLELLTGRVAMNIPEWKAFSATSRKSWKLSLDTVKEPNKILADGVLKIP